MKSRSEKSIKIFVNPKVQKCIEASVFQIESSIFKIKTLIFVTMLH